MKHRSRMLPDMNQVSVKWRIFIFMAIFIVITICLLWLFQIVFLDSIYKNVKINELRSSATTISWSISSDNLPTVISEVCHENTSCVLIADENGNILHTQDSRSNCIIHKLSLLERKLLYNKCQERGGNFLEMISEDTERNDSGFLDVKHYLLTLDHASDFSDQSVKKKDAKEELRTGMIYCQLIEQGNQKLLLMIDTRLTPLATTTRVLIQTLIYVTLIMLMMSLILTFILHERISRPIRKTIRGAHQLAHGDYNVEFHGKGYLEITELNEVLNYAAVELSKAEKLKHELIANVSHDLRTPLAMIIGYAEMMRDIPEENTPENVQVIIDEASRLSGLVNDLLDISKMQSGNQGIVPDVFSLTANIEAMLLRYSKLVEQDGYFIKWHYDQQAWICADEMKISQVLYNLINNAVNYCGKDKTVEIFQTVENNAVTISIIDHGTGIEPENLKYVWDRYYKVDKTHKRATVGTGLGLSIVKSILEQHQAEYGVESAVGQGSNFWFRLPLFKDEPETDAAVSEPGALHQLAAGSRRHVKPKNTIGKLPGFADKRRSKHSEKNGTKQQSGIVPEPADSPAVLPATDIAAEDNPGNKAEQSEKEQ